MFSRWMREGIARIAYPTALFKVGSPQILAAVIHRYNDHKFGIKGIRKLLGVKKRPCNGSKS